MDELTLALLGNKDAQDRFTERKEILPCPFCGGKAYLRNVKGSTAKWVTCKVCLCDGETAYSEKSAIYNWNTRPQILNDEQMKCLEKME